MVLFKLSTIAILLLVFIQDFRSRSVYWILFPLLALLLIIIRLQRQFNFHEFGIAVAINLGFLLVQLLILTIYFSAKHRQFIHITNQLLGLGDILFLTCIAFYLSALNFLVFYTGSLSCTLLLWLPWQLISSKKNQQIPLAGLQSLFFILFLAGDWWLRLYDLTSDTWLLNLANR